MRSNTAIQLGEAQPLRRDPGLLWEERRGCSRGGSAKPTGRKQVAATEAKPLDHWEALASPGGLANTPSFDIRMGGLGPCSRQEREAGQ